MPSPTPKRAPVALLLAWLTTVMAAQASAEATWKVELVPTPITRDKYEAATTLPATCFKISQAGKCGSSSCCCGARPPTTMTIKNVAPACARTNKPPSWTVDGIPQDGTSSARYFGKGAAKLSGGNSPSLTFTLPAWAEGQTERVVCVNTDSSACGTFAKICNNRASCPMMVSGTGTCGKTSKCTSPTANAKTAPLATATHAMVLEFEDAAKACSGGVDLLEKVANAFEKDIRTQLVKDLGSAKAAKITNIDFKPQFCSSISGEDGKPTGRYGLVGYATITGAPDLVDDVLKVLDQDTIPTPAADAAMCSSGGGGASCGQSASVLAVSFVGAPDPGNTVTYSPLLKSLQTYLASGFDILTYDPTGALTKQQTTKLDVSNWLRPGKVYDLDSVAAACADDGCFSKSSLCASSLSTTTMASTTERQDDIFASVEASGEYLGVTASASASFRTSQTQLASSEFLSVLTQADCNILTFHLPFGGPVQFSSAFVSAVNTSLNAITAARDPNADAGGAAEGILNAFSSIYNNYGTHIPLSIGYGGYMRLELLMQAASLKSTFKSESMLNAAFSHAVADLSASGSATSDEAKQLFSSTSSWSFITIPQIPSISLKPIGAGNLSGHLHLISHFDANGSINVSSSREVHLQNPYHDTVHHPCTGCGSVPSFDFSSIPANLSGSLTPIGSGGYQINPTDWTGNLSAADQSTLYPRVISTKSLAALFREAAAPGSPTALQFGAIDSAAMAQMDVLARAYLAYVINDPTQWPAELAGRMPQLLQNPNYLKDGQCVKSPLIVRVNKNPEDKYDASFRCITCVRGVETLPSDPDVSIANPDTTKQCTVGSDFSLASVKAKCKPCRGCEGQGPMCPPEPADPNVDWGAWQDLATCDGCVQCVSEANCVQNNNNKNFYGGYGDGGPAKCAPGGRCVQCLSSDNCHHNGPCSTADERYVCT